MGLVTTLYGIYEIVWANPRKHRRDKVREAEGTEFDRRMLDELQQQRKQNELILAQLSRLAGGYTLPRQAEAVDQAVTNAEVRAQAGDERMRQALDLLAAGKVTEAEPLFRIVAEEKAARIVADSFEAAEAFRNLGAIAYFSDPRRAREAYAKATQLDPENIDGMLWHAEMEKDSGNLIEAERAYNIVITLATKNLDGRTLYWALQGLGDIRLARGNLQEALLTYQQAADDADRLAKADPDNAGWQRDLSVSYNKVGDVLVAQGNLPEALKSFRDSLAIADRLAKADPDNAGWQRDLSVSYNKVGDVLVAQGNLPEALKSFRDSLAIADRLAKADPDNAGWQADLAASHGKLGQLYLGMGDRQEARRLFEQGRGIVAPFAEKSGHQLWIGYLTRFDAELAALE